ncbi:MAG TPA: LON peptidase substrate-binding domain-containing protein [Candidatus Angelobacter sp.]|nr:LON peptidase substrate-binding domain-containing protein [Candidatus Angelobacter sp.]
MELPREVPVMTLPSAILFPQAMLPLYIFEPRYRQMLADALSSHRMFSVAMQKPGRVRETPCQVAGLGLIRASVARTDGTSNLVLQGIARVELGQAVRRKPYRVHRIRTIESTAADSVAVDALTVKVLELVSDRLEQGFELPFHVLKKLGQLEELDTDELPPDFALKQGIEILAKLNNPEQIADLVSGTLLSSAVERQLLLETVDLEARLKHLISFLMAEIRRQGKNKKT